MNFKIMGHPLNWLIVVVVALVGAFFWMHMHEGAKQATAAVKGRMNGNGRNGMQPGDDMGGSYASAAD